MIIKRKNRSYLRILQIFLGCLCLISVTASAEEQVLLFEEFYDLDDWAPFYFPNIDTHSTYTILEGGVLQLESKASASAA